MYSMDEIQSEILDKMHTALFNMTTKANPEDNVKQAEIVERLANAYATLEQATFM